MIINNPDKPGIETPLGWSGGDGVEHVLARIRKLVNKCYDKAELLLRDGEGCLSPTALLSSSEKRKIQKAVDYLVESRTEEKPPLDSEGNAVLGTWDSKYFNVPRAFEEVLRVALRGDIYPGVSVLDMEKDLARCFIKELKNIRLQTYKNNKEIRTMHDTDLYDQFANFTDRDSDILWARNDEIKREVQEEYEWMDAQDRQAEIDKEIWEYEHSSKRYRTDDRDFSSSSDPWWKDPDQRDRSYEYNPDWYKKNVDNLPF